jgi:hypothetical protein
MIAAFEAGFLWVGLAVILAAVAALLSGLGF